jgi:hypothetical protein
MRARQGRSRRGHFHTRECTTQIAPFVPFYGKTQLAGCWFLFVFHTSPSTLSLDPKNLMPMIVLPWVSYHHPGKIFTRVKIYSSQSIGVTDRVVVEDTLTSKWAVPGPY